MSSRLLRVVQKLDRAERKLVRAFNEWAKLRRQVQRYEKKLDREWVARASEASS